MTLPIIACQHYSEACWSTLCDALKEEGRERRAYPGTHTRQQIRNQNRPGVSPRAGRSVGSLSILLHNHWASANECQHLFYFHLKRWLENLCTGVVMCACMHVCVCVCMCVSVCSLTELDFPSRTTKHPAEHCPDCGWLHRNSRDKYNGKESAASKPRAKAHFYNSNTRVHLDSDI